MALRLWRLVALTLAFAGCGSNQSTTGGASESCPLAPEQIASIASRRPAFEGQPHRATKVCQLTGEFDRQWQLPTAARTESRYGIVGTDLGFTVDHNGKLFFLFGDTAPVHRNTHAPEDDVVGFSSNPDPSPDQCLNLQFRTRSPADYRPLEVPGLSQRAFEVPVGGFSANGKLYAFLSSGHSASRVMGYSVLTASSDDGATFSQLYTASSSKFINIAPVNSGAETYFFGSGTYRESSPYLARAATSAVEQKSSWRFFKGTDASGAPLWGESESEAQPLFTHPCIGELSVAYSPELQSWLMMYNCGDPRGINLRRAPAPWGPWSQPQVVFEPGRDEGYCHFMHRRWEPADSASVCDCVADPGRAAEWGGEYGPSMIPRLFRAEATGVTLYFVMSTWNPYNTVLMKVTVPYSGN